MIRILGTVFAGLLGLAFGSFLNVCLSRWPHAESVVSPRSHCRMCDHALSWWENIPLLSWLILRGRCRSCSTPIGWRYPLVELAVGLLWAYSVWTLLPDLSIPHLFGYDLYEPIVSIVEKLVLCWLLAALAVFDAENFWLPDRITLPGIAVGCLFWLAHFAISSLLPLPESETALGTGAAWAVGRYGLGIVIAAGNILLIRWIYWLIRHREGIGLGDAKLMALLAAWLGLPGAILAFCIGAVLGAVTALALLATPAAKRTSEPWSATRLPLGTFLCIGGIVSALWGQGIIEAYLRWSGFS
jgi:leader peptidase (prepilin peptidase)/N-methyltransferase